MTEPQMHVGIPWRPTADRIVAFDKVRTFYEDLGFRVHTLDSGLGRFNPARARNLLVQEIAEVSPGCMVLSDADSVPEVAPLLEAINEVLAGEFNPRSGLVHLPYHLYHRPDVKQFAPREPHYVDGACSGTLVFSAATWRAAGGQDERFQGWGFEDTAFRLAHETLLGPMVRHRGTLTAWQHGAAPRDFTAQNRSRMPLYRTAYGNVESMRQLISGNHLTPEPAPRTFASGAARPHGHPASVR